MPRIRDDLVEIETSMDIPEADLRRGLSAAHEFLGGKDFSIWDAAMGLGLAEYLDDQGFPELVGTDPLQAEMITRWFELHDAVEAAVMGKGAPKAASFTVRPVDEPAYLRGDPSPAIHALLEEAQRRLDPDEVERA